MSKDPVQLITCIYQHREIGQPFRLTLQSLPHSIQMTGEWVMYSDVWDGETLQNYRTDL